MFFKLNTVMPVLLFLVLFLCPEGASALEQRKHMLGIGIESQYYSYEQGPSEENGFLYGANAAYIYHGDLIKGSFPKGMYRLDGKIIFGKIEYDGQLFDGNHYVIKHVKEFNSELRGVAGYDFSVFSSTTLTPYFGVGYRYLKDDLSKDNAGYRRYFHWFYTPIGFETRTPLSNGWTAGIVMEYDLYWLGWAETCLNDLDSGFSDLTNDQKDGYGFRFSFKFRKEMEDKNYVFEPYFNYWDIDDSETEYYKHNGVIGGTYTEDQNTTSEIGLKVGVEF